MTEGSISKQIDTLQSLVDALLSASTLQEKLHILHNHSSAENFSKILSSYDGDSLTEEQELVIKSVIAIGQEVIFLQSPERIESRTEKWHRLLDVLCEVERFYDVIGGIVGYHFNVLKLIEEGKQHQSSDKELCRYTKPEGIDVSAEASTARQAVIDGLKALPQMAEIYPVGGAGDRLNLRDEATQEPLPAARLLFCGRTLLESLFRDLQAKEYLYYKLFDKQITTPVAMMTSHEKHNHQHILEICEEANWFGRPKESFFLFIQPLAPVITEEGNWSLSAPLTLSLKPGGHGVIWKLAKDHGVFDWLAKKNRSKALLRQINNPIGGTDLTLLAFTGIGCRQNKAFGFVSCYRLLDTAEGMVVLKEKKNNNAFEYCMTNVEYTEFAKQGIEDRPYEPGSPYSAFPANTNILFVDLPTIQKLVGSCPIPGMLVNMKNQAPSFNAKGKATPMKAGRLESTMQNIADYLTDTFSAPLHQEQKSSLKTFVMYNERAKTISVTKKAFDPQNSVNETPEKCFYDLLQNHGDLLKNFCGIDVPPLGNFQEYLKGGPSFLFLFHPALGPLYSIIAQKIQGGTFAPRAELQLEIAELSMQNITLSGSLLIQADAVTGGNTYSNMSGKCTFHNVKVVNQGIDTTKSGFFWKSEISRKEAVRIILHGNGEFVAENVSFEGPHLIEVPDSYKVTATEENGRLVYKKEKIQKPSWWWEYSISDDNAIKLTKKAD